MAIRSLDDLLLHTLQDIYDAEQQALKALPRLAQATQSAEVRRAFEQHLAETRAQVERLERVFEELGEPAQGKKCVAMAGLVAEAQELLEERPAADVLDAGLIAAQQKIEHYEIASYGTVMTWLKTLGHEDAVRLLAESLAEEEATDRKLTQIAKQVANPMAAR